MRSYAHRASISSCCIILSSAPCTGYAHRSGTHPMNRSTCSVPFMLGWHCRHCKLYFCEQPYEVCEPFGRPHASHIALRTLDQICYSTTGSGWNGCPRIHSYAFQHTTVISTANGVVYYLFQDQSHVKVLPACCYSAGHSRRRWRFGVCRRGRMHRPVYCTLLGCSDRLFRSWTLHIPVGEWIMPQMKLPRGQEGHSTSTPLHRILVCFLNICP